MHLKVAALAALASTVLAQPNNLASILQQQPSLSNLTSYLSQFPNLVSQLGGLSNITLLAPNNDAFGAFMSSSNAAALSNNQQLIQAIFTYHVLNGTYTNITNTTIIPTALQPPTYTNVTGGQVVEGVTADNMTHFFSGLLDNSTVVGSPLNFTGGVIHIIDRLLTLPQNISTTAVALNLTSAVGALQNTSLRDTVDTTSDVTIFVPDNSAFRAIGSAVGNLTTQQIANILEYHVVNGSVLYSTSLMNGSSVQTLEGNNLTITIEDGDVFVNSARVTTPDVLVANGVLHIIDEVLNPMNTTAMPNPSSTEVAFPGATSASNEPFTSGIPTPTSSIARSSVASVRSSASASESGASSSSSGAAWMPQPTGAMGAAALFGGAAVLINM